MERNGSAPCFSYSYILLNTAMTRTSLLVVWERWGWDMSLADVRKRPGLWERRCPQSNWPNRMIELVWSEVSVIEWVDLKESCCCGKTGFCYCPPTPKPGERPLLVGWTLTPSFTLFIYQGCHGDEEGLSRWAVIPRGSCLEVTRPFQPGIV